LRLRSGEKTLWRRDGEEVGEDEGDEGEELEVGGGGAVIATKAEWGSELQRAGRGVAELDDSGEGVGVGVEVAFSGNGGGGVFRAVARRSGEDREDLVILYNSRSK